MNKTVILIHGMWSQAAVWNPWIPALQNAGFNTLALNLPGHEPGASPTAMKGLGLADYVAHVVQAAQGHSDVVLVGHSMGGLIAQQAAVQLQPKALVLVSSAVPAPIFPLRLNTLLGTLRSFSRPELYWSTLALTQWEANYLLYNKVPEHERTAQYNSLIRESGRAAYQLAFGGLNLAGSNRVDWAAITCPVLYLAGKHDRIVPASAAQALAKRVGNIPGSRFELHVFEEHAHMMMVEESSRKRVDEILSWLSSQ